MNDLDFFYCGNCYVYLQGKSAITRAETELIDGIRKTYDWFLANYDVAKGVRRS